eukprot:TRINITY_DN600_c2_g2_i1.p1 TRINITY_DN600_c2_g2~~TRINITY_DN600_c2_g2_i1.p1  ORF type:complete len:1368 (-),score=338.25 TRINITY_DN600_c2_g2_i1:296-4399(-)
MGQVKIVIQEGRDLPAKRHGFYCIVYIVCEDGKRRKVQKTPVKKGTVSPLWASTIMGKVPDTSLRAIVVDVYTHGLLSADEFCGRVNLVLGEDFEEDKLKDAWYPLAPRDGRRDVVCGDIRLCTEFLPYNKGVYAKAASVLGIDSRKHNKREKMAKLFSHQTLDASAVTNVITTPHASVSRFVLYSEGVRPMEFALPAKDVDKVGLSEEAPLQVLENSSIGGLAYLRLIEAQAGLKWFVRTFHGHEVLDSMEDPVRNLQPSYHHWVELPTHPQSNACAVNKVVRRNWTLLNEKSECLFGYSVYFTVVEPHEQAAHTKPDVDRSMYLFGRSIVAGPVLLARGVDADGAWRTGALVVTRMMRDGQAPKLAVTLSDDESLEAQGKVVKAFPSLSIDFYDSAAITMWRFEWSVRRTEEERVLPYRLSFGSSVVVAEYVVPASLHNPSVCTLNNAGEASADFVSQQLLLRHHATIEHFNVLLQASPQINAVDVLKNHFYLADWMEARETDKGYEVMLSPTQYTKLRDSFVIAYCASACLPPMSHLVARIPSLMMWEATDLFSESVLTEENVLDSITGRAVTSAAKEAFELFQLGLHPGTTSFGRGLSLEFIHGQQTSASYTVAYGGLVITAIDMWSEVSKCQGSFLSEEHQKSLMKHAKVVRANEALNSWLLFLPNCNTSFNFILSIVQWLENKDSVPNMKDKIDELSFSLVVSILECVRKPRERALSIVMASCSGDCEGELQGIASADTVTSVLVSGEGVLAVQAVPLKPAMTILTQSGNTLPSPSLFTQFGEVTSFISSTIRRKKKTSGGGGLWKIAKKPRKSKGRSSSFLDQASESSDTSDNEGSGGGSTSSTRRIGGMSPSVDSDDEDTSPPLLSFSLTCSNPDITRRIDNSCDSIVVSSELSTSAGADDDVFVCGSADLWKEPCDGVWNIELVPSTSAPDIPHPHLVKAANFNKLVERLSIPPLKRNENVEEYVRYLRVFFMTFRAFATAEELFTALEQRFDGPKDVDSRSTSVMYPPLHQVQVAVCRCLGHWVEFHFGDFCMSTKLRAKLMFFCKTVKERMQLDDERLTRYDQAAIRNLLSMVESKGTKGTYVNLLTGSQSLENAPDPIIPERFPSGENVLELLQIHPLEVARQITIAHHHIYSEIQPVELQDLAWSSKKLRHRAPNVLQLTEQFNNLNARCACAILSCTDAKDRKQMMLFWLDIARYCREMNNFDGAMAIVSAFGSAAVYRLRQSFDALPKTHSEVLSSIREDMAATQAFKAYRAILSSIVPPCMPFIGVFLTDLTFIADGNPDTVAPYSLLNFRKRELEYDVIVQVLKYQSPQYKLQLVPRIIQAIEAIPMLTGDEQFEKSLICEPRKPKTSSS